MRALPFQPRAGSTPRRRRRGPVCRPGERREKRTVTLSLQAPAKKTRARLWAFAFSDFARFFGLSVEAVKKAASRARVDLGDLESVLAFAQLCAARRARREERRHG